MNKLLTISLLCLFSGLSTLLAQDDLYLERAVNHYQGGNYKQAISDIERSLDDFPKSSKALYFRGHSYMYLGDMDQAIRDLHKAAKYYSYTAKHYNFQDPRIRLSRADVYLGLGYIYNEADDYQNAKKWLHKALDLEKDNPNIYNNLGIAYAGLGDERTAIEQYNLALELDSTFALAYNNRGAAIYYNQNIAVGHRRDIELAIEDFNKALSYQPEMAMAIRNRGVAKGFLKEFESAQADIEHATRLEPNNAKNYTALGHLYYNQENYEEAISFFMKGLKHDPHMALVYVHMGNAKARLGYYQDAIKDQYRAMEVMEELAGLSYYNIACSYALMQEKEEMFTYLKKSSKEKYLKDRSAYEHFLKDPDFDNFRQDEDFIAYRQKLKKKLK